MARKLTVYTGKGVGVFDLSARPDMYTEPQAATIVMHDQEEHERVFTESEVKDIARKMNRILAFGRMESSNKAVASMLALHGIVLDPA